MIRRIILLALFLVLCFTGSSFAVASTDSRAWYLQTRVGQSGEDHFDVQGLAGGFYFPTSKPDPNRWLEWLEWGGLIAVHWV